LIVLHKAIGLVDLLVPGATPKNPYSGLIARKRPSSSKCIQAISSPKHQNHFFIFSKSLSSHLPIHSTLYPGIPIGWSIAKLVLPQALKDPHKNSDSFIFQDFLT
jgi:hypothetical protein